MHHFVDFKSHYEARWLLQARTTRARIHLPTQVAAFASKQLHAANIRPHLHIITLILPPRIAVILSGVEG